MDDQLWKDKQVAFTLGYSTCALKMVDPFEAVQLIKDVGYDALEVCAAEFCFNALDNGRKSIS